MEHAQCNKNGWLVSVWSYATVCGERSAAASQQPVQGGPDVEGTDVGAGRLGMTCSYVYDQHSMWNLVKSFDDATGLPTRCQEMLSWPHMERLSSHFGAHRSPLPWFAHVLLMQFWLMMQFCLMMRNSQMTDQGFIGIVPLSLVHPCRSSG